MSCGYCVNSIEGALKTIGANGKVNLMEAARLETEQTSLQLTGMTCAACANRIEKGLNKLEGVTEANVNYALERATVTNDPKKVNVAQMEQNIQKLGYGTAKEVVDFKLEGISETK